MLLCSSSIHRMRFTDRVSFAVKHVVVHVFFYWLPRLVFGALSRWPRWLVSRLTRGKLVAEPPDEREVTLIANEKDPYRLRRRFGLPLTGQPPLRYHAPLYSGHIHTILAAMRSGPRAPYERELVESYEGQHVNMDYLYPLPSSNPTSSTLATAATSPFAGAAGSGKGRAPQAKGLMFIVPGLLNASTTNYVRRFAVKSVEAGFAVCVLNSRGMGTTPLEVPRLFSATFTEDIRYCLHHYLQQKQVQERLGTPRPVPLIAVGFSLGGVTLIKYLGEQGMAATEKELRSNLPPNSAVPDTPVSALVTVTCPYDLIEADRMSATLLYRCLYEKPFAMGLRKYAKHNREMLAKLPNVDSKMLFEGPCPVIDRLTSIRAFDKYINASHNGFSSPQEYYAAAQPLLWLPRCRTPILCIGDRNDTVAGGFVPDASWRALVSENPYTVYVCYPVGGHLGFLGTPAAEWRGDASEAEHLVLRAATKFCETT
ncbi:conserved hypothetical protein [Leishmania major strain Friedlin]|uniref:AB hydrolase-1 domain-containing protein n=1 Tax=Leishmania major TaxID=5664 RepID=Q4QGZ4_LEIMA|nr:conserved hypothetical protein [Leishmania major strain Friedlin]CAG9570231.1 Alpha/beta_hydrolase_family_-_putative [Leishmania major strain Friedlin]CAJ02817.1 conserved hypothetical protein [Leishmania major strain Friedlin]|eukprot:XP_001681554.1 conserved hypothetical protein [Leishmania major strain Friedlin]